MSFVPTATPIGEKRLEAGRVGHFVAGEVAGGALQKDVEVAHLSQPARDLAKSSPLPAPLSGDERVAEYSPGRP